MLLCIFKFCLLVLLAFTLDLHAWDIIGEKYDFLPDKVQKVFYFVWWIKSRDFRMLFIKLKSLFRVCYNDAQWFIFLGFCTDTCLFVFKISISAFTTLCFKERTRNITFPSLSLKVIFLLFSILIVLSWNVPIRVNITRHSFEH